MSVNHKLLPDVAENATFCQPAIPVGLNGELMDYRTSLPQTPERGTGAIPIFNHGIYYSRFMSITSPEFDRGTLYVRVSANGRITPDTYYADVPARGPQTPRNGESVLVTLTDMKALDTLDEKTNAVALDFLYRPFNGGPPAHMGSYWLREGSHVYVYKDPNTGETKHVQF